MNEIKCPNCATKIVQKNRDGEGDAIFGFPVIVKSGRVVMTKCRKCKHIIILEKSNKNMRMIIEKRGEMI